MIGHRLKLMRELSGMSIQELASRADISIPLLARYQSGDAEPPVNHMKSLAKSLGITFEKLLEPMIVVSEQQTGTIH